MSVQSEINRLKTAKTNLASAIESKGVDVSDTATLSDYPALVSAISTDGQAKERMVVTIENLEEESEFLLTGKCDTEFEEIVDAIEKSKDVVFRSNFGIEEKPVTLETKFAIYEKEQNAIYAYTFYNLYIITFVVVSTGDCHIEINTIIVSEFLDTALSENSDDYTAPSSKAVYDSIQSALTVDGSEVAT